MDIRQILQLKEKNWSNRKIAEVLGIHRNSVNEYVRQLVATQQSWEALSSLDDKALSDLFISTGTTQMDRYERLSTDFKYFACELKKRGCTKQQLWQAYCQKDPDPYRYTQFCKHLNKYLQRVNGSGKLVHKAGDKLYVDYTGGKLSYTDPKSGEVIQTEVYVGILPSSHLTYAEASLSQGLADFVASTANCLTFFGGVPQSIVTDNLKSAVTKSSRYEPILNKTFRDLSLHYGTVLNPTRSYAPQDKALVESAVKLIYQRIFYPLNKHTFFSLQELNAAIAEKLKAHNDYLMTNTGQSRWQQFLQFEQSELQPLPAEPYVLRKYRRAKVQKMGYVYLGEDRNYYSVPYRYIGKGVEIAYDQRTVSVYHRNERIAQHQRTYRPGTYVTIKDHLSSTHQFYRDWSPAFFAKLAAPQGTTVVKYITKLIDQAAYPETAYKQCLGIINLSKQFSRQRLHRACEIGLDLPRLSYRIILKILENGMDQITTEEDSTPPPDIDPHHNIRGADYYQ